MVTDAQGTAEAEADAEAADAAADARPGRTAPRPQQGQPGQGLDLDQKKAEQIVASRPYDHLSSILAELREVNIGRADPGRFDRVKELPGPWPAVMARDGLGIDDAFYYPDVRGENDQIGAISPIRYLAQLIRPNTTAVVSSARAGRRTCSRSRSPTAPPARGR